MGYQTQFISPIFRTAEKIIDMLPPMQCWFLAIADEGTYCERYCY